MRWILICVIGFLFFNAGAQRLYLKLAAAKPANDSLVSSQSEQKSFQDITKLRVEFEKIVDNLHHKGYFNLRFSELYQENDSLFSSKIQLNKKYNFIKFYGVESYDGIFESETDHVKTENLSDFLYKVLNFYSKKGKPFSQIKLKNISFTESDTVYAELSLQVSKTRKLDDVVIRGYERFPRPFITNYADIKIGEIFDKDKLVEKSEKIELLKFVKQKQPPQVQFAKDSTKLFLYLERNQANSFDGFIGFNNSENNEFQLNGNIDLNLVNNFHAGEEIQLNYKNDGNAQEWFDATLRLPYILRTKFGLQAGLSFFKQDSTFSNTKQHLKLDYQIKSDLNIGLKATFENSSDLLDNSANNNISDFNRTQYGIEAQFNNPKRLNRLFLNTQFLRLGFGLANRESENLNQRQEFIEIHARQTLKLHKRQYVFVGLNGAYLNSTDYLSNELYRFGGVNSMRGFIENRFFANLYGALQTEYRYVLGSNLYVHSVLDYGFYENDIDRFSENLYSVGFGFGLETKAGVLRLILASGGSDSQRLEFRNTQIHIKFISIF
jgi:hypothetical protein